MSGATGLSFVVITFTRPLVPLLAQSLGAGAAGVGVVVSAYALVPLFLAVPAGALVDRLGSRRVFLWGSLGIILGLTAVGLRPTLSVLLAAQATAGLSELMVIVAGQTYVSSLATGTEREAHLGWYTTLVSAGQLLGPLAGGILADMVGYGPSFLAAALLGFLPLAVGSRVRDIPGEHGPQPVAGRASSQEPLPPERASAEETPGQGRAGRHPEPAGKTRNGGAVRRILRAGGVRLAIVTSFAVIFTMGVRQSFYPIFVQGLGYPASLVGAMLSLRALAAMAVRPFMPRIIHLAGGRFRTVFGSMLLAAGSLAITPWTREPLTLALASMAGGIGIGLVQPLSMLAVAETVDEGERGLAMGLRLTGNRAAQFTSPVLFGLVAEVAGLETAFVVGGLLLMAATATLFLWRDTFARLDRRRSARRP